MIETLINGFVNHTHPHHLTNSPANLVILLRHSTYGKGEGRAGLSGAFLQLGVVGSYVAYGCPGLKFRRTVQV